MVLLLLLVQGVIVLEEKTSRKGDRVASREPMEYAPIVQVARLTFELILVYLVFGNSSSCAIVHW